MEREGGRGRLANLCCKLESPGELEKVVPAGPTPRDLIFMICRCSQLSRGFQLHPGPREPLLGRKKRRGVEGQGWGVGGTFKLWSRILVLDVIAKYISTDSIVFMWVC